MAEAHTVEAALAAASTSVPAGAPDVCARREVTAGAPACLTAAISRRCRREMGGVATSEWACLETFVWNSKDQKPAVCGLPTDRSQATEHLSTPTRASGYRDRRRVGADHPTMEVVGVNPRHKMSRRPAAGDDVLLACDDGCERRVVITREREVVVIDRGDFYALHGYSNGAMDMSAGLGRIEPS